MVMKIIAVYIIIYELCANFIIVPVIKKWLKSETDEQLLNKHPVFLSGVALGHIVEIIVVAICVLGWLFV